jgi:phosphoribosylglycinamide formyltransferase-1
MKATHSDAGALSERFVGEPIVPVGQTFATAAMANGAPGLPASFTWRGREFAVTRVLAVWKDTGDCRHGSGERYVRKHWYQVQTSHGQELKIYFERQRRSSGGSRWRLYTLRDTTGKTLVG